MTNVNFVNETIDNLISVSETDDLTNASDTTGTTPTQQNPGKVGGSEEKYLAKEVVGDPPTSNGNGTEGQAGGSDDDEVENSGEESAEDDFETASFDQLTSKPPSDSAVGDIEGLEGFDPLILEKESDLEQSDDELLEAGSAIIGAEAFETEEFGFLSSIVPTLVSSVGPLVAKAVGTQISERTRSALKRRRKASKSKTGAFLRKTLRRDRILTMISKVFEAAESMPDTESGVQVDEALVSEIAGALEVVIGKDDRVRITKTKQIPWRRICALRITFPSGKRYRGTGFFIGPRAVATAGHCVYLHNQGGWAREIEVIPGANGASKPYGTAKSRQFRSVRGWVTNRKPAHDYGCIVVPSGSFGGRNLGQFGFGALRSSEILAKQSVLAGFPGDKPFGQMYGMARKVKTAMSQRLIYDIDTTGGSSGSPMYIKVNGSRIVIGIHNYGAHSGNSATRVTQQVYAHLNRWRSL